MPGGCSGPCPPGEPALLARLIPVPPRPPTPLERRLGLAASMFSQPIDVPAVREDLRLALGRSYAPRMLLRFGFAAHPTASARRPVQDVLEGSRDGARRR